MMFVGDQSYWLSVVISDQNRNLADSRIALSYGETDFTVQLADLKP